jgi:hypothetical protein
MSLTPAALPETSPFETDEEPCIYLFLKSPVFACLTIERPGIGISNFF